MRDTQLGRWLEKSPETLTDLFPSDVSRALSQGKAWWTDGLLCLASRAVKQPSNGRPPHSSSLSFGGRRLEPYSTSMSGQPFVEGAPASVQAGGANSLLTCNTTKPVLPLPAPMVRSPMKTNDSSLQTPSEVGACLASFVSHWEAIDASPTVISLVSRVRLEFKAPPPYLCMQSRPRILLVTQAGVTSEGDL